MQSNFTAGQDAHTQLAEFGFTNKTPGAGSSKNALASKDVAVSDHSVDEILVAAGVSEIDSKHKTQRSYQYC